MRGLLGDARHTARALLRRPGFSLLTIGTLAIGIGAATAIFSLAEALLLRPLPLEHNDRLVRVFSTNPRIGMGRFSVSYPDFRDLVRSSDLFEASSLYEIARRDVSGEGEPERITTAAVLDGFFQTLGSPFHFGRAFTADDHDPRTETTVVLARSFWTRHFGSDPTILGASVRLDGTPHTVIGVVDDAVAWPRGVDAWRPLQWAGRLPEAADRRSNHAWQVIARLRAGVDDRTANARVQELADAIYAGPDVDPRDEGTSARVVPLQSSDGDDGAGALFATLGTAVLLVLLIACINASGLLLVRSSTRTRELSLRAALGASRGRLVAIMLGESLLLSLVGGAVGVVLGVAALGQAFGRAPPDIAALGDPELNLLVVTVGVGLSVLAALLAGLAPALGSARLSVSESLKQESGRGATSGRGGMRWRQGLVVVEIACSLALLTGAVLTIRGFQRQIDADPGFDSDGLLSFTVRLPSSRYGDAALVDTYFSDAVERLERHPGILAATAASRLPLGSGGVSLGRSFIFDGATPPPEGASFPAAWIEVDERWLDVLGLPVREGRAFTSDDSAEAPLVAIVNERMAQRMSPDEPIVGRTIRSVYDENLPRTVVGVVSDFQLNGVSRAEQNPVVLVPRRQAVRTAMTFLARTAGDPLETTAVVRNILAELDADVALDALQPLHEAHAADLAGIRFLTTLFATFGALALALAVSGVYGLVATSVGQRTQEIGVRLAIGASAASVRLDVVRESALLGLVGTILGLALAWVAGRVLAAGMDGIAIMELSTYVATAALLALAVLTASWIPAMRVTRIDPVEALRTE